MQNLKTVMLKKIPENVDELIRKEQMRLDFFEGKKLKKEQVVYQMLLEWYLLKSKKGKGSSSKTL